MVKKKENNTSMLFGPLMLFLALSILFLVSPAASETKTIELKFGHIAPPFAYSVKHGLDPWAKKIEEATNGKAKVKIYHAQSLFKARDAISAIESGLADMGQFPIGYFSGRFNLITVIDLPFLFPVPTAEFYTKIVQGLYDTTPEIQKEFASMKLLVMTIGDPYYLYTRDRAVKKISDFKGLKLRVIGKYPSKAFQGLKSSTVMIPSPGLYGASAKGVIDGGLVFSTMLLDLKLYEVFNYYTDVPVYSSLAVIAMNLKKWNSLPQDIQQGIESVSGLEGGLFIARNGFDPGKAKILSAVKREKQKLERVAFDEDDLTRLKEKIAKPLWEEWVKDMEKKGLPGQMVFDKAVSLVEKYK